MAERSLFHPVSRSLAHIVRIFNSLSVFSSVARCSRIHLNFDFPYEFRGDASSEIDDRPKSGRASDDSVCERARRTSREKGATPFSSLSLSFPRHLSSFSLLLLSPFLSPSFSLSRKSYVTFRSVRLLSFLPPFLAGSHRVAARWCLISICIA